MPMPSMPGWRKEKCQKAKAALALNQVIATCPTCTCREFAARNCPQSPAARNHDRLDPIAECKRIFPETVKNNCPLESNRDIGLHTSTRIGKDHDGNVYRMYRMYVKEVSAYRYHRAEKDLVLGEWAVSEELAEASLYNIIMNIPGKRPADDAPLGLMDAILICRYPGECVPRFASMCSACGKARGFTIASAEGT